MGAGQDGVHQMVRSPRRTNAWSYSGQLVTRYLVLWVGWTFERLDIIRSLLEPVMYTTNGSPTGQISIHAPTPHEVPATLLEVTVPSRSGT